MLSAITHASVKKERKNKGNKSSIYPVFPVKIIFQGKQRHNEEEFFFIQKLQLINAKGTKELEIHHFAIPNERVDLESACQWLLKPLQQWFSNSSVRQNHLV